MVFQGRPFFGEDIQKLGRMSEAGDWEDGIGEVTAADIMDQYVDRLLEGYDGGAFRIAWDTGNGAAGPAVEKLTAKLPGEHVLLFTEVDGNFPNHHPDPTAERNLADLRRARSEEHTSELQSLMRTSYAVFCLKKKHTILTIT